MSKHPIDWIIHCMLCFVAIYFRQATLMATIFVASMIEYEQWKFSGQKLTWNYFYFNCLGDLIADMIGIIGGIYAK
ncbi:MAG: hypothetical protein KKH44_02985 [Bacteroidetes bacterium]|nr:hypothetical protein [Bacteroidota bacterium]